MTMSGGEFLSLADMGGNNDGRVSYGVALIQQALHYGVDVVATDQLREHKLTV
jgi:hypothetical protein